MGVSRALSIRCAKRPRVPRGEHADTGSTVTLGDIADRRFIIVRETDVAFDVIKRMWRKNAIMALVVRGDDPPLRIPRANRILGIITKEHVADAVAAGIQAYPR